MAKAKRAKQISFSMKDRAGLLSDITNAVSGAGVNITAVCAYAMNKRAYFMMTTESNALARKALGKKLRLKPRDEDVVAVEMSNRAGALQAVADRLAEAGINILYMYGSTSTGRVSNCVFSTSDNAKAVRAINK
jgi:hypothetical protein